MHLDVVLLLTISFMSYFIFSLLLLTSLKLDSDNCINREFGQTQTLDVTRQTKYL